MRHWMWSLFLAALPCACLDMPITTMSNTGNPVIVPDGGPDSGQDPQAVCEACLRAPEVPGPGCQVPYDACVTSPGCRIIKDCAVELGCLQGSKKGFIGCVFPCLARVVMTPEDPVLDLGSTLFQCLANGPCGDMCFSTE
jgi:hypothetical protein